jgi:hypothetical protein
MPATSGPHPADSRLAQDKTGDDKASGTSKREESRERGVELELD